MHVLLSAAGYSFFVLLEMFLILWSMKVKLYSKHIGKSLEQIEEDISRPKYFSPSEAVEYGIIDKVPIVRIVT